MNQTVINEAKKGSVERMKYNFDEILDRSKLSTKKWEMEQDRKNDRDLLCFGTAEMDFKTSPEIIEAFRNVVETGHFGYPYKRPSYYEAVSGWFERHCGMTIQKEWIANSVAIYPSFQGLIDAFSDPGDEVIFNSPVHFIFYDIVRSLGRKAVENPLKIHNGQYEIDFQDLEAKITDRTRLFILCNPHNPVGRAWNKEELKKLSDICVKHGILIISDEVYLGLIYPGKAYTPMMSVSDEAAMNCVTCISPSKSFNLTGIKHSLVISKNAELLEKYNQQLHKNNEFYGESIFGHAAVEAAFGRSDEWSGELMKYIEKNYIAAKEFLAENMPEVKLYTPDATYFLWMDFNCLGMDAHQMTAFFEDEAHVEVSVGDGLGTGGRGFVRMNAACPKSLLLEGLNRIASAMKRINK